MRYSRVDAGRLNQVLGNGSAITIWRLELNRPLLGSLVVFRPLDLGRVYHIKVESSNIPPHMVGQIDA